MMRDVVATMLARVLGIAFGIVTTILTAHFLGPAGRGEYFLVLTILNLIAGLGVLGLPGTMTYLSAGDRSSISGLHAAAMWISIIMGTVGTVVAYILAWAVPGKFSLVTTSMLWLFALAPLVIYGQLSTALLIGVGRIVTSAWVTIVQGGAVVVSMGAAVFIGAYVQGFLGATMFGNILYAVTLAVCIGKISQLTLWPERHVLRRGAGFGARSLAVSLLGLVVLRANVLVLGNNVDHAEVGYYSIAAQLSDALIILPGAVAAALFPRLMAATERRWEVTRRALLLCGGIHLATCIVTGLFAPLIPYIFGVNFRPSITILYWLLPSTFFYGITAVVSQYLAAAGIPRSLIVIWAAAAALIVASSSWLVPSRGAVGAAMALSLTCAALFLAVFALAALYVARLDVSRSNVA